MIKILANVKHRIKTLREGGKKAYLKNSSLGEPKTVLLSLEL